MIAPNDSPKQGGLPQAMASTRRLAAILAADVAGYSRLMGADEEGTHERLKAHRRQLVDPKIAEHHGRIVKRRAICSPCKTRSRAVSRLRSTSS
jgi:class 3 adenylate cyclase